jgi:hypothetical protein
LRDRRRRTTCQGDLLSSFRKDWDQLNLRNASEHAESRDHAKFTFRHALGRFRSLHRKRFNLIELCLTGRIRIRRAHTGPVVQASGGHCEPVTGVRFDRRSQAMDRTLADAAQAQMSQVSPVRRLQRRVGSGMMSTCCIANINREFPGLRCSFRLGACWGQARLACNLRNGKARQWNAPVCID